MANAALLVQTRGSFSLRPALRDERSCVCSGRVQEINSSHAWILPSRQIDHADAWKNRGSIYLDVADISPGVQLQSGDAVIFYLYANDSGLGAQDCCLKSTFVMNLSEKLAKAGLRRKDISHAWVLDESDSEEEAGSSGKPRQHSDTDSTGFVDSEEEDSSSDEDESCEEELEGSMICEPCEPVVVKFRSKGSCLHASGRCKPCGFFMWGECENGEECLKCHEPHASRFSAVVIDDSDEEEEAEAAVYGADDDVEIDSDGFFIRRTSSSSSRSFSEEDNEEVAPLDATQEKIVTQTIAETAPMFAAMLLQEVGAPPGLELGAR